MRLFIAVPLPDDIAAAASAILPGLPGVRRVRPDHMHVTLAFLGSVDTSRLPDVYGALRSGSRGVPPFDASLGGLGRFPDGGAPRIVWLGFTRGAAELIRLADGVRRSLTERAVSFDAKPFRAHVTLARVGDRAERDTARALVAAIARGRTPSLDFHVGEVAAFESVVTPKGPRYTRRATVSLEVGEDPAAPTRQPHP